MGRKKPAALRPERPIEFGLDSVRIPEQQIGPPLRAEAGHIHKCETRPHREINVAALRAIHFKGRLEHGRRIAFLDHLEEQPGLAVLFGEPVSGRIIAAHSFEPCQNMVELFPVERLVLKRLEVMRDVRRPILTGSLNLDELRHRGLGPFPCRALSEVLLPVGIVESEGREQA